MCDSNINTILFHSFIVWFYIWAHNASALVTVECAIELAGFDVALTVCWGASVSDTGCWRNNVNGYVADMAKVYIKHTQEQVPTTSSQRLVKTSLDWSFLFPRPLWPWLIKIWSLADCDWQLVNFQSNSQSSQIWSAVMRPDLQTLPTTDHLGMSRWQGMTAWFFHMWH